MTYSDSEFHPDMLYRDGNGRPVYVRDRPVADRVWPLDDVSEPCPVCQEIRWQEQVTVDEDGAVRSQNYECGACGFRLRHVMFSHSTQEPQDPADRRSDQDRRAAADRVALAAASWRAVDLGAGWSGAREVRAGLNRDGVLTDVTVRRGEIGAPGGLITLTTSYDPDGGGVFIFSRAGAYQTRRYPAANSRLPHSDLRRCLEERRVAQVRTYGTRGTIELPLQGTTVSLDYGEYLDAWFVEGSYDGLELMLAGVDVPIRKLELRRIDSIAAVPDAAGPLGRDSHAPGVPPTVTPDVPDPVAEEPAELAEQLLTLAEVQAMIAAAGFVDECDQILAGARPGFRLERTSTRGEAGTNRVGGHPGLTAGEVWPHGPSGSQMVFVAQIDLGTLPALPDGWPEPLAWSREPGVLRLFADLLSVRGEPVRAQLMLAAPGVELTVTAPPEIPDPLPEDSPYADADLVEELTELPERDVVLVPFLTLPETVAGIKERHDDFSEAATRYSELTGQVRAITRPVESWTQVACSHLLGEPLAAQSDPREAGSCIHRDVITP